MKRHGVPAAILLGNATDARTVPVGPGGVRDPRASNPGRPVPAIPETWMTDPRPIDIVILAKQVPDTHNVTGDVMTKDGTMNRGALSAIFNPEDLNALEMALQIKERHGGTVTVITMGPPKAANILRDSLWRGADKVIVRCTMPCLLTVVGSANTPRPPSVRRQIARKLAATASELPALRKQWPEFAAPGELEAYMGAHHLEIPVWTADDIGAAPETIGLAGSPT